MTKVLVVEDNPLNMELVLAILETDGFDAYEAIDGEESLKMVDKDLFDSYAMKGDRERFLSAGFEEYVSKPIDITDFHKRLEKYRKQ